MRPPPQQVGVAGGLRVDTNMGSSEGGAEGSVEETEEPERELGLAGARRPPRAEARHSSPLTGDPRGANGLPRGRSLGAWSWAD